LPSCFDIFVSWWYCDKKNQAMNSSSSRLFVGGCDHAVPLVKTQQIASRERKSFCRSYPPKGRLRPFWLAHPWRWCILWMSHAWFRWKPGFAWERSAIVHVSHTKHSKE
jgi:hypothetical protein